MRTSLKSDHAQNTFEYLLAVGGVMVLIIAGLYGLDVVVEQLVGHLCPSVDTANPLVAAGSCITS